MSILQPSHHPRSVRPPPPPDPTSDSTGPTGPSPLQDPTPLHPLTSLKWPYVPDSSSYPDPLTRDDPKLLQLHQYEAIGTSPRLRDSSTRPPTGLTLTLLYSDVLNGPHAPCEPPSLRAPHLDRRPAWIRARRRTAARSRGRQSSSQEPGQRDGGGAARGHARVEGVCRGCRAGGERWSRRHVGFRLGLTNQHCPSRSSG